MTETIEQTDTVERAPRRTTYRPFVVDVVRREVLGEHFVRLTFGGDDLDLCGDTCLDQRAKLVLATGPQLAYLQERCADPDFEWYPWWLSLDEVDRPPMRTYTLRKVRRDAGEVDIDFACHGEAGPASVFALRAQPGDRVVLIGPDAEVDQSDVQGVAWRPDGATEVLLAGDETAVPAICGILETLGPEVTGHAFLEVPSSGDLLDVSSPSQVVVTWLVRGDAPFGAPLTETVGRWAAGRSTGAARPVTTDHDPVDPPENFVWEEAPGAGSDGLYVWLAGESGAITRLRRSLINDAGLDKLAMSFMGYWKEGVSG